ncbi:unnamed protein product [Protopolystoma xenopodis]|uniref:Uncharacterized protein n=1 Tax=Protopolystoma xenopodis TaxID=117903 RepID=A0A448WQX8_9PLAT|nr:unnamed protein product [Protopolystoma xenopodis]
MVLWHLDRLVCHDPPKRLLSAKAIYHPHCRQFVWDEESFSQATFCRVLLHPFTECREDECRLQGGGTNYSLGRLEDKYRDIFCH